MKEVFPNIKKGETLTGVHQPGVGARFFHNGKPLAEVRDAEFSRRFFGIWLASGTSEPELRSAVAGRGRAVSGWGRAGSVWTASTWTGLQGGATACATA